MTHRRAIGVLLILLVVPSSMAGAIWLERVLIANWAVARILDGRGLGPARPGIETIGLDRATLRGLSLCGGAFKAQAVTVRYDLPALVRLHFSSVIVAGLQGAVQMQEDGLALGPCRVGSGSSAGGTGTEVDELRLDDAHLVVSGQGGSAEASLSASLSLAGGAIEGRVLDARISTPLGGAERQLRITAHAFSVAPEASGGVRLLFDATSLAVANLPIEARGIAGALVWSSGHADARMTINELTGRKAPTGITPLALDAEASLAGRHLRFAVHAAGPGDRVALKISGRYALDEGSGTAELGLGPVALGEGGPEAAALVSVLGGGLEIKAGSLSVTGSLRFSAAGLVPDLLVRIKDVGFDAAGAEVHKLSGAVRLTRLWPPATAPHQQISASVVVAGLPPAGLHIEGQLTTRPALSIEDARLQVAGGTVSAEPFNVDPTALRISTALKLENMDLAEIIRLLNISGLVGSGRLSGRVPLTIAQGRVSIGQARLAAAAPGVIRYDPKRLPPELAGAGPSLSLALEALRDFHYDTLTLELQKAAEGRGTVLLHLNGKNPAVLNGQVFHFNIRVESDFDRLAELALINLSSVQTLLRQAEQRGVQ